MAVPWSVWELSFGDLKSTSPIDWQRGQRRFFDEPTAGRRFGILLAGFAPRALGCTGAGTWSFLFTTSFLLLLVMHLLLVAMHLFLVVTPSLEDLSDP